MSATSPLERLMPELRAYALSLASSRADAEDLVQDAVERALTAQAMPLGLDDLRPWMFRVLRNLHTDLHRKARVRREYSETAIRYSIETPAASDTERDVLLRRAYAKLSPEAREVLFLVDIMGLKYAEAAQVMGVANGTVMSRLSRARRALIELIDGPDSTRTRR